MASGVDRITDACERLRVSEQGVARIKYDYPKQVLPEQRYLFLLHQVFGSTWKFDPRFENPQTVNNLCYLQRVSASPSFQENAEEHLEYVDRIASTYGVIPVRDKLSSERPKLVIGCGRYVPAQDEAPSAYAQCHDHADVDTIDLLLCRNPTWVGLFDDLDHPNGRFLQSTVGSEYYQTIFDEAPTHYNTGLWRHVDALLKPGGMFIGTFYSHLVHDPIPEGLSLQFHPWMLPIKQDDRPLKYFPVEMDMFSRYVGKPWWAEHTHDWTGKFIITKADADGKHPLSLSEIPLTDFPEGFRPTLESSYTTYLPRVGGGYYLSETVAASAIFSLR